MRTDFCNSISLLSPPSPIIRHSRLSANIYLVMSGGYSGELCIDALDLPRSEFNMPWSVSDPIQFGSQFLRLACDGACTNYLEIVPRQGCLLFSCLFQYREIRNSVVYHLSNIYFDTFNSATYCTHVV